MYSVACILSFCASMKENGGGFGIRKFAGLGKESNLGTNCMKDWPRKFRNIHIVIRVIYLNTSKHVYDT